MSFYNHSSQKKSCSLIKKGLMILSALRQAQGDMNALDKHMVREPHHDTYGEAMLRQKLHREAGSMTS
jgi:hypothetical protein